MLGDGGSQIEALRPDFGCSILIDFQGARSGMLLLREMDERIGTIAPMRDCLEDRRSSNRSWRETPPEEGAIKSELEKGKILPHNSK